MGFGRAVLHGLRVLGGLLRMIVGDGEEKIPESTEPLERRILIDPDSVLEFDLDERWIGFRMEALQAQLVVHAVMDVIEPLNKVRLTCETLLIVILLVEIGQGSAAELTGEHIGNCFEELLIGRFLGRLVLKGGIVE